MFDVLSNKLCVRPEERATCLVVDLLLRDLQDNEIISHEVAFADHRRRADLVICGDFLTGIEVKSEQDNVSQAIHQLADYVRCFDYNVLATTEKQIRRVYDELPRTVGLIEIREDNAVWRRKPLLVKRKSKPFVSSWLDKLALAKLARQAGISLMNISQLSVYEIRQALSDILHTDYLIGAARCELYARLEPNFERFMRDYTHMCTPEDLMNLRRKDVGLQLR